MVPYTDEPSETNLADVAAVVGAFMHPFAELERSKFETTQATEERLAMRDKDDRRERFRLTLLAIALLTAAMFAVAIALLIQGREVAALLLFSHLASLAGGWGVAKTGFSPFPSQRS